MNFPLFYVVLISKMTNNKTKCSEAKHPLSTSLNTHFKEVFAQACLASDSFFRDQCFQQKMWTKRFVQQEREIENSRLVQILIQTEVFLIWIRGDKTQVSAVRL